MKEELDEIIIVDWKSKEQKRKMNFAMLLTYAKMSGGVVNIKIGAYDCIFKVIMDKKCECCGSKIED